jgi:hypothetical protein
MIITFDILKKACRYTGKSWRDSENCNHPCFSSYGDTVDGDIEIRSHQQCKSETCPILMENEED